MGRLNAEGGSLALHRPLKEGWEVLQFPHLLPLHLLGWKSCRLLEQLPLFLVFRDNESKDSIAQGLVAKTELSAA